MAPTCAFVGLLVLLSILSPSVTSFRFTGANSCSAGSTSSTSQSKSGTTEKIARNDRSLSMFSAPAAISRLNEMISSNFRSNKLRHQVVKPTSDNPLYFDRKTSVVLPAAANGLPDDEKKRPTPLKIVIAGAPAAGKGTQCEVITREYGVVHLSTGDILRAAVKAGTALGLQAKAFMDAGQLVPDELIIGVVKDRLQEEDCQTRGWLLDGFPRTKSQAEALTAAGLVPDCFVLLDVPEEVLVERVTGRRTDPVTGKIYHMRFSPPESEEVAARLVQRSDDTEEKIKVRYREFQAHIGAIRSSYEDRTIRVDGALPASRVTESVKSSLSRVVDELK